MTQRGPSWCAGELLCFDFDERRCVRRPSYSLPRGDSPWHGEWVTDSSARVTLLAGRTHDVCAVSASSGRSSPTTRHSSSASRDGYAVVFRCTKNAPIPCTARVSLGQRRGLRRRAGSACPGRRTERRAMSRWRSARESSPVRKPCDAGTVRRTAARHPARKSGGSPVCPSTPLRP